MAQVCAKTAGIYAVKVYGLIVLLEGDARGQDRDRKITYQLVDICGEARSALVPSGVSIANDAVSSSPHPLSSGDW